MMDPLIESFHHLSIIHKIRFMNDLRFLNNEISRVEELVIARDGAHSLVREIELSHLDSYNMTKARRVEENGCATSGYYCPFAKLFIA